MGTEETHREATERGRIEGRRDAKIEDHGKRLDAINGSISATREAVAGLQAEVVGQRRDIKDLGTLVRGMVPEVQKLIAEGIGTKQVAEALEGRKMKTESGDDRGRARIAWAIGLLTGAVGLLTTVYFIARSLTGH